MNDADNSEIELLRRLHRDVRVQLAALEELPERTPEDELRLRWVLRVEQRLMHRIESMLEHNDGLVRQGRSPCGPAASYVREAARSESGTPASI